MALICMEQPQNGQAASLASVSGVVVMSVLDFLKFEFVLALWAGDLVALQRIPLVRENCPGAVVLAIVINEVKCLFAARAIDVERPIQACGLALDWCVCGGHVAFLVWARNALKIKRARRS